MVRWLRVRAATARGEVSDEGAALVEFIGLSLLLLVPLVYLVVTFAQIQAGIFAAESAASQAARTTVVTGVESLESGASRQTAMNDGARRAQAAVALAAEDFGFASDAATLSLVCEGVCLGKGANIVATVTVVVELPGIPGFVSAAIPLEVEVQGSARAPVDSVAVDR